MLGFIAAIQKVVNDLRTDYTNARAAKLDNLDVALSSRAAASTAMSSATWTALKASYLDVPVSSVGVMADPRAAMVGTVGNFDSIGINDGTGVGAHNVTNAGGNIWIGSSTDMLARSSNGFNYWADQTVADTYVTIADITGGGWLFAAIACGQISGQGNATQTIRITVDGVAYTLAGTVNDTSRLVWGLQLGYGGGTAQRCVAAVWSRLSGVWNDGGGTFFPVGAALFPSMLRFRTSLKVESKCALLATNNTTFQRRGGAMIVLDGGGAAWS